MSSLPCKMGVSLGSLLLSIGVRFTHGLFVFGGLFLLLSLPSTFHLPPSPFSRSLSHRIIIRQIRLSAASLHDMPITGLRSVPCFYNHPRPSPIPLPIPTRLVKSSGLPAPQASPRNPPLLFRPTTLASFTRLIPRFLPQCRPLTSNPSPSPLLAVYIDCIDVLNLFWLLRGISTYDVSRAREKFL